MENELKRAGKRTSDKSLSLTRREKAVSRLWMTQMTPSSRDGESVTESSGSSAQKRWKLAINVCSRKLAVNVYLGFY